MVYNCWGTTLVWQISVRQKLKGRHHLHLRTSLLLAFSCGWQYEQLSQGCLFFCGQGSTCSTHMAEQAWQTFAAHSIPRYVAYRIFDAQLEPSEQLQERNKRGCNYPLNVSTAQWTDGDESISDAVAAGRASQEETIVRPACLSRTHKPAGLPAFRHYLVHWATALEKRFDRPAFNIQ